MRCPFTTSFFQCD